MKSAAFWCRAAVLLIVLAARPAADPSRGDEPAAKPEDAGIPAIVIRGGWLFDAATAEVRANEILVIENGRISGIGNHPPALVDPIIINAAGQTILPGLIDMHVHFGAPAGSDASADQAALLSEYLQQRPRVRTALLDAGVTSIRSVGDVVGSPWWGIVGLKNATRSGQLTGPRVFAAGPIFTAPEGHPAGTLYRKNAFLIENATRQVTDPDEARRLVGDVAAAGLDGVKVVYDDGGGKLPRLAPSVMEAIIDEAHRRELWTAAHTGSNNEVRDAVNAGADTIEHGVTDGSSIEPETLKLLKARDVTYVPTLAVTEAVWSQARDPELRKRFDQKLTNVRDVHQAGIAIAAGTDTQGPRMQFGNSLHRELQLLVQAGLTPAEALQAATRNAARALKVDRQLGTLEAGKVADVVLVEGDATRDIEAVANVRTVIQRGRIVVEKTADDAESAGDAE